MTKPATKNDIPSDFAVSSQISEKLKLGRPYVSGSFGDVYHFSIETSEGTSEVAVKVVKIHPSKPIEKIQRAMRRELDVWLRLSKYPTIVPLLDIVHVGSQLPAIISRWMPSGTLCTYLKQASLTAAAKAELITGVAEGLGHLHSENVIHGDLHPANVLIDDSGNPRLTDFGLATVVGDPELQWGPSTAGSNFNPQWRAPEVIGINGDPELPTFESDIYSFGSVMLFVVSGDVPWKHKGPPQIVVGLAERANPASARPNKILDNHWVLIQKCWSWDPWDRPRAVEVLGSLHITGLAIEDNTLTDFTSQIFDQLKLGRPYASKSFGAVYRCTVKTSEGTMEVAVKVLNDDRRRATEKLKRAMRRELDVWLRLSKYPTIVPLLGIAYVDSPFPALVSQWMSSGTLDMYLEQGTITASNKVELITGVAEGLMHLHSEHVVHGDLHPANVLLDGSGRPRLTDFSLATVARDAESQWGLTTAARELNVRWRAPEVIGIESEPERPTFESDIYSFGGVMFLIASGIIPWKENKNAFHIMYELSKKTTPAHPGNILDDHWNLIQKCWSWEPDHRPTATKVLQYIDQFRTDNAQGPQPNFSLEGLVDLKGQIVGTIVDSVAAGDGTNQSRNDNSQAFILNPPFLPTPTSAEDLTGEAFKQHANAEQMTVPVPLGRGVQHQPETTANNIIQSCSRMLSSQAASSTSLTHHTFSVPALPHSKPFNVLIFGEAGVGKSSIIDLILGRDAARMSPDQETYTLAHTPYEISLGIHCFKLWEVPLVESKGFFWTSILKWRLKRSYKRLYKNDGVYLLLYCMRGSGTRKALVRDYKSFTDIVASTTGPGRVPVAAVVTSLENHPQNMDEWWMTHKDNLERLGMQFSSHACITSLPDDPHASPAICRRRQRSEHVIRSLLYPSYQTGSTPVSSNIVSAS